MLLYHGSKKVVERPNFSYNKAYRDFGNGFYLTINENKAKSYASSSNLTPGIISKYEFDTDGLRVLNLTEYPILSWLAILYNYHKPNKKRLRENTLEYLNKNFYIDVKKYDVVIGYRCDDMWYSIVEAFFNNVISVDFINKLIIKNNENTEVVLLTDKAINKLKFIGYEEVDNNYYYKNRYNNFKIEFSRYVKQLTEDDVEVLLKNNTAKKMINNFGICMSFACKYLGFQANEFFKLFASSKISIEYAKANPKYIYGMSGVELAYEILIDLGFDPKNVNDYELDKDINFWAGRILAYIQYMHNYDFKFLAEIINVNLLLDHFEELSNQTLSSTDEYIFKNLVSQDSKSRLQSRRKIVELSQTELAEKANINVRTLQQYEIKSKNINNASITNVMKLAEALGCKAEDILEYITDEEDEVR